MLMVPFLCGSEDQGCEGTCSTSQTRWSYTLRFTLLCCWYTAFICLFRLHDASGLKTLTFQNASWCAFQKPVHFASTLAASSMLVLLPRSSDLDILGYLSQQWDGNISDLIAPSNHMAPFATAQGVLNSVCFAAGPKAGVCHPYLKARASQKVPLCRTKPFP